MHRCARRLRAGDEPFPAATLLCLCSSVAQKCCSWLCIASLPPSLEAAKPYRAGTLGRRMSLVQEQQMSRNSERREQSRVMSEQVTRPNFHHMLPLTLVVRHTYSRWLLHPLPGWSALPKDPILYGECNQISCSKGMRTCPGISGERYPRVLETGDGTTGSGVLNSDGRVGNLGKVSRPALLEKQQQ